MQRLMHCLRNWWLIFGWLAVASSVFAASQTDSLTVGYSSFAGAYGPLWIAVEEQLGRKHGLELKAIYAGRIRPQQLLASGEVPYVVATGRPGAFADTMVRYVLRAKLGLVPDRDVKLLPMGEAALTFPALEKGIVEAASLTMPFNLLAKKMGFRELVDYDRVGVVYPYNTVTTLRQTPAKNPELTDKLLKSMIEGIHVFKTNKQKTIGVLKKYMRGAGDDILEETYESTKAGLETVPIPSLEVVKTALEILSYQYPQAKQTDPNLIIDPSYVKKIEQSGFITSLYKK